MALFEIIAGKGKRLLKHRDERLAESVERLSRLGIDASEPQIDNGQVKDLPVKLLITWLQECAEQDGRSHLNC